MMRHQHVILSERREAPESKDLFGRKDR